jgi:hypothetical protein
MNDNNSAAQPLDLDKLEALARAVDDLPETTQPFVSMGGQVVIHTFSMSPEQVRAVANLYDAATPAAIVALISQARASQQPSGNSGELGATGTTGASIDTAEFRELADYELRKLHRLLGLLGVAGADTLDSDTSMACFWGLIGQIITKLEEVQVAPASAQPDRGAAQELLLEAAQFLDDSMFQSAGQAARAENLAAKLRAPSPASQPVAPEASQAFPNDGREPDWAGYAAAEAAHAQQEAAPTTKPWKDHEVRILVNDLRAIAQAFHATEQLRGRISDRVGRFLDAAVAPSDANDATVPDHSERGAANAGGLTDGWKLVPVEPTVEMRHACYEEYQRPGATYTSMCRAIIAAAPGRSPATIAAGQEAANAKDVARLDWLIQEEACVQCERLPGSGRKVFQVVWPENEDYSMTFYETPREAIDAQMSIDADNAAMAAAPSSEKGGA